MGPLAQEDIRRFVLGGKSTFTVQNKDTGNRFTYRVKFASDKKDPLYFVGLLSGPDNSHDYSYIGIIHRDAFRRTGKSEVTQTQRASRPSVGFGAKSTERRDCLSKLKCIMKAGAAGVGGS